VKATSDGAEGIAGLTLGAGVEVMAGGGFGEELQKQLRRWIILLLKVRSTIA